MAKIQRPVEGCQAACCRYDRLVDIPPKPEGVTWGDYTPHLTGTQIMMISTRWERTLAANTGRPMRRCPTGWPADLGAAARAA